MAVTPDCSGLVRRAGWLAGHLRRVAIGGVNAPDTPSLEPLAAWLPWAAWREEALAEVLEVLRTGAFPVLDEERV